MTVDTGDRMRRTWRSTGTRTIVLVAALAGCGKSVARSSPEAAPHAPAVPARVYVVRDTLAAPVVDFPGRAEALLRATLASRLMGRLTSVRVQEGSVVRAGELLATVEAGDLHARREAMRAQVGGARAAAREATAQVERMRSLYRDSAATRAQRDAAERGYTQALAGVEAGEAALREVETMLSYAELRAPFAGTVVRRYRDPGDFVTPGAPVLEIHEATRLRITVQGTPSDFHGLTPGMRVDGVIEEEPIVATVEGVVTGPGPALQTLNALVDNPGHRYAAGAARLRIPIGRPALRLLVPEAALVTEGDLVGVDLAGPDAVRRWVRTGRRFGAWVEVLSGLAAGDSVRVPERGGQ